MNDLAVNSVGRSVSLRAETYLELVADEVATILFEIAGEFSIEATLGSADASGLRTAAAVLRDLAVEALAAPPVGKRAGFL